jgi:hypothetical protein
MVYVLKVGDRLYEFDTLEALQERVNDIKSVLKAVDMLGPNDDLIITKVKQ